MVNRLPDCTLRITYAATVNSDDSVVYGDTGNPNEVVLTWKRTSSDFYDTLVDDAHVYAYGLSDQACFPDGKGDFSKVEFILHNDTDDYFVKAELNEDEGIYYVTGSRYRRGRRHPFHPPCPLTPTRVKLWSRAWKMTPTPLPKCARTTATPS